jgi:3-oxoadipate enol-lactonase
MTQDLHYQTAGRPADRALLLVHPLGNDLRFWDECVAHWAPRFYCVAPDLRAAGRSPLPDQPVGVDGHVADLERLREHLGIAMVVPIGCALGGMVAAAYAARHPERTAALIVANPGVRNSEAGKRMLRERVALIRRAGMAALVPEAPDKAFLNLAHDVRYRLFTERYAAQEPERYARSALGFLDADISADAARVACPTLIVRGEHDVLMSAEQGAELSRLMPKVRFVVMKDTAHFVPFQAPERFAALVAEFLDTLPG